MPPAPWWRYREPAGTRFPGCRAPDGHRPGPWECDEDGKIYAADAGLVAFVQPHGCIRTVFKTGEDFSHADGRLIAAAPTIVAELAGRLDADTEALSALLPRVQELETLLSNLGGFDVVERLGVSRRLESLLNAESPGGT